MTERPARRRSTAEWVTLSLSVLVVGALIVVALVEESRRQEGEGTGLQVQVTFDMERVAAHGESFYVPYTVLNTGSEAISSAEIWIEVYDGERVIESAEINVQFLPLQGKQNGLFVTTHDPASHALRSRVESLQFP